MPDMAPTPIAAPAPTQPPAQAVLAVARALDAILGALFNLLWTRALTARLLGSLAGPVITRLLRTRERLALALALALAHLAAGDAPRSPRPGKRSSGARIPFPNRRAGWLAALLDHQVRNTASQLATLLHQPGIAETLAASPGAARTLRPLCRMFGVELPAPLRRPPPPPRPTRPRKPARPTLPKLPPLNPPLQPYVLAAARAWKRPEIKTA